MRRKLLILLLSVCVIVSQVAPVCAADSVAVPADDYSAADFAGNQILVSFNDNVSDRTVEKVVKKEDCECSQIEDDCGDMKIAQVEIPDDLSVEEAIGKFEKKSKVVSAQPNYRYVVSEEISEPAVTDKESRNYQYQISQTNADKAWKLLENEGYKKAKTKVCVIDTGIDVTHEDLQVALTDEIKKNGFESFQLNRRSMEFVDTGMHGTHVSGIIGATYGNSLGGCGIASGTTNDLVELEVIGASPDGDSLYTYDIIEALYEAKADGAQVINMSFGTMARDRLTEAAVKDLYDSGIVLVAAAGNESYDGFTSPSSFKEVISVNATTEKERFAEFSNYGKYSDISAPGYRVYSTVPGDAYAEESGTSMASPVVAGICAMVLDANPSLTPAQVRNIICSSTGKSFSNKKAYGIIDAEKSVQAAHDASASIEATGIEIKEGDGIVTIEEGDYAYINAMLRPANILYSDSLITWNVENPSVVKVDSDGKVTGLKKGKTIVTVSAAGISIPVVVEVTKNLEDITTFAIKNKEKLQKMEVGNLAVLYAETNEKNADIYWETDNPAVTVLSTSGGPALLQICEEGTANLTAMTKDVAEKKCERIEGVNCDTVKVTVSGATVRGEFVKKTNRLLAGEKYTFKMKPLTENDEESLGGIGIEYESLDPAVAEVNSETGEVTALKSGVTYITGYVNYLPYEIEIFSITLEIPQVQYGTTIRLEVGAENYTAKDYGLKASSKTADKATLKWNSLKAVSGYHIYKKVDGKYTLIKTVSKNKTSFTDTKLKPGTAYSYKVKAYYENKKTGLSKDFDSSSAVKVLTEPSKVTGLKGSSKNGKASLSWTKSKGADGYVVYRKAAGSKTYKQVATVKSASYVDKNVKKGKTYRYKVKAYAKSGTLTTYADVSKIIKVKVK